MMSAHAKYEIQRSEKLGRYLVAARDLRPGDTIISEQPFALGPHGGAALVCFSCHLPLLTKFLACKMCGLAPVCAGDGCPEQLPRWHNQQECDQFRGFKLNLNLHPLAMVQNVGALIVLRVLMMRSDPQKWEEFALAETHLEERRGSGEWEFHEGTVKFIESLGLLHENSGEDLVQKICAAIDVNSFEVRGPAIPAIGVSEALRGVYLKASLMAHDCVGNTHVAISDSNQLVCRASTDIKKGETIFYNYTDVLRGTALRRQHLLLGKYFTCACARCADPTELGSHLSSARCGLCAGLVCRGERGWACLACETAFQDSDVGSKVQSCAEKFAVINKTDETELEEYIRNVSALLAPSHYLLLAAKQRLAGVLRDVCAREPRPPRRALARKVALCAELLPVLEVLQPGVARTKAITLYELHAGIAQLAKRLFESNEIDASAYLKELLTAETHLKRSLEMLFMEPGNSPEGELCARALEEYRALKATMAAVTDGIHADGKTFVSEINEEQEPQPVTV